MQEIKGAQGSEDSNYEEVKKPKRIKAKLKGEKDPMKKEGERTKQKSDEVKEPFLWYLTPR